jgi:hypothetical protein
MPGISAKKGNDVFNISGAWDLLHVTKKASLGTFSWT